MGCVVLWSQICPEISGTEHTTVVYFSQSSHTPLPNLCLLPGGKYLVNHQLSIYFKAKIFLESHLFSQKWPCHPPAHHYSEINPHLLPWPTRLWGTNALQSSQALSHITWFFPGALCSYHSHQPSFSSLNTPQTLSSGLVCCSTNTLFPPLCFLVTRAGSAATESRRTT